MAAPMADDSKRKAEEAEGGAAAVSAESPAKKARVDAAGAPQLRKQVEYYLSDENLKFDKFFHEKISADSEGWLDMSLVLSCKKMQALKASVEDVVSALQGSSVELRETDDAKFIRRPGNAALPTLEVRHLKKQSHAHDGGCVIVIRNIPEDQSWKQVKEALKLKLPEKVGLWHASPVSDQGQCVLAVAPFECDVAFLEALVLHVGGKELRCEVPMGDALQTALKVLPANVRERRIKEARKVAKERNRPIVVGLQRFLNVAALRGRVREIMNSRTEGEPLKTDGTDFKLIRALLDYHPKAAQKTQGLTGLKVAKSVQGDNRCMWIIREGGECEDFSVVKCMEALEKDPPYAEDAKPAAAVVAPKPASEAIAKTPPTGTAEAP